MSHWKKHISGIALAAILMGVAPAQAGGPLFESGMTWRRLTPESTIDGAKSNAGRLLIARAWNGLRVSSGNPPAKRAAEFERDTRPNDSNGWMIERAEKDPVWALFMSPAKGSLAWQAVVDPGASWAGAGNPIFNVASTKFQLPNGKTLVVAVLETGDFTDATGKIACDEEGKSSVAPLCPAKIFVEGDPAHTMIDATACFADATVENLNRTATFAGLDEKHGRLKFRTIENSELARTYAGAGACDVEVDVSKILK